MSGALHVIHNYVFFLWHEKGDTLSTPADTLACAVKTINLKEAHE